MAILFDLDGVFYRGDQTIAGGAEVLAWVRRRSIPHLFLTNTTSRPRSALLERLSRHGIETDLAHLLTPPVATVNWCREHIPQGRAALFVPEATRDEFADLPVCDAEGDVAAVIVGDLGEAWDFATLNRAFRLLMRPSRPRLLALGMTRYWQAGDGLRLDVAPFVTALACAADVEPLVLGKPAAAFYRAAIGMLGVDPAQIVMVGDDIRADIDGAQKVGLQGVLVRTGKFRETDLALGIHPAAVLDSIADLPSWYESQHEH